MTLPLASCSSSCSRWRSTRASISKDESSIIIDDVIGGAGAVLLLGYLVYALLRPEKF
jgi:K+-transporting ATPase KdpF subunit